MLKDQSELNSSRVPRRHSRKIPTPCESSSMDNDAHDWLGAAPLYPHQWKHASSRGYRHRRPPYGRAKAACHARHATFPFLSVPPSAPIRTPTVPGDTCTATSVFRRELTLPDPFRRSNDQHQRDTLRLSLLPKTVFVNRLLHGIVRSTARYTETEGKRSKRKERDRGRRERKWNYFRVEETPSCVSTSYDSRFQVEPVRGFPVCP